MSNAVAVIPLTFDGVDVQENDFGVFLEIVRGLNESPSVRGTDTTVPGREGQIPGDRIGDKLPIELRGVAIASGSTIADQRAAFAVIRQVVRTLFDPRKLPKPLVGVLEDGSTATIQARTLNTVWIQDGDADAVLSIEMFSIDPDWVIVPPP